MISDADATIFRFMGSKQSFSWSNDNGSSLYVSIPLNAV